MRGMGSQPAIPGATSTDAVAGDAGLIERARQGDEAAFDELIRPRLDRLLRLAISITANESDGRDVVQEACVQAWRHLPRLRDTERFDAWLSRIVVNGCRSTLRGRRRRAVREISIDAPAAAEPTSSGATVGDQLSRADTIRRAFARLDPDKRSILVLHHVEGQSVADIAHALQVPSGTVMWRLHAARRALERALEVESR